MSISAKIIADSLNPKGVRLTSFILRLPRPLLAELNTHRAFSRNSASSRAIPFQKMLDMVKNDPFIPIRFQKDHKGMQGTEYFEGEEHERCVRDWLAARDAAVAAATSFTLPITKQLKNRLLEAFMWHTVIVTATDYENFFALRAHPDAEIHIAELARQMLEAYNASEPKSLRPGEWHIPFGDKIEKARLWKAFHEANEDCHISYDRFISGATIDRYTIKVAVARCARISFLNYEGKDDYAADIKLCDRLFGATPRHLSPTEHVAQCLDSAESHGNFRGWKQYRYTFPDQNLGDSRVKRKIWVDPDSNLGNTPTTT